MRVWPAGAGTHLDTRTAAVCDGRGRELASLQVRADPDGYAAVLSWARDTAAGRGLRWAVEGTRHCGLGLARHLASAGEHARGNRRRRARRQAPQGQERRDRRGPGRA
jgi:hypothetical protein